VTNTDVFALRRSDLNEFLFAEVGVETNGMTLRARFRRVTRLV
jgi:hypothetical protein